MYPRVTWPCRCFMVVFKHSVQNSSPHQHCTKCFPSDPCKVNSDSSEITLLHIASVYVLAQLHSMIVIFFGKVRNFLSVLLGNQLKTQYQIVHTVTPQDSYHALSEIWKMTVNDSVACVFHNMTVNCCRSFLLTLSLPLFHRANLYKSSPTSWQ